MILHDGCMASHMEVCITVRIVYIVLATWPKKGGENMLLKIVSPPPSPVPMPLLLLIV